jgi:putative peptide maturation dehydrogenase
MRIRRRNPCLLEVDDELLPDFGALLRGTARLEATTHISLLCPASGKRIPLSKQEAAFIAGLSSETWCEADELAALGPLDSSGITSLVARGALISDLEDAESRSLREREALLHSIGWHPLAAVYHAHSRWHGVVGDEGSRDHGDDAHAERLSAHAGRHGPLPPHFHRRGDALERVPLPIEPFDDALAKVLRERCTTRHFDASAALPLEDFTRVLYGTFGAIGTHELAPDMVALKRTSASGGGLHPIEAYPLVLNVEGLPPGFYHYETGAHALALLRPMDEPAARELASALTIGQAYFAQAQALVFHIARVDRHHWKYRRHAKAYKALLMDSGHLSQTFYLLAAERGLGAFFTAAINDGDLGELLQLDPGREIAIGANGLGIIDRGRDELHLRAQTYRPPR